MIPRLSQRLLASILLAAATPAPAQNPTERERVEEAVADFNARRNDAAIEKLKAAEQEFPNSAQVLNVLGAAYVRKKDYETAIGYFRRAIEADPSFFPAQFNSAEIFFLQKQYPQALDRFTTLLRDNPQSGLLRFKVLLSLLMTNQREEAERMAAAMPVLGADPCWYYSQAALLFNQGRKDSARDHMKAGRTFYPGKADFYEENFEELGWR